MKDTLKLLQDMLHAIKSIESYEVSSYDAFLEDEKTQDAIMYNLIIMGEAANKIPHEFQEYHSEIPWPSIIGTRKCNCSRIRPGQITNCLGYYP